MACCKGASIDPESQAKNDEINKGLQDSRKLKSNEIKLLLLGAGESGKSTVAKQMKIIHKDGYTNDELKGFVNVIHTNVYQSCKTLLQAGADLGLDVADQGLVSHFEPGFVEKITPELGAIIKKFWADEGVQGIYKRRAEYQLTDSTDYYLGEIDRISAADYLPTVQD